MSYTRTNVDTPTPNEPGRWIPLGPDWTHWASALVSHLESRDRGDITKIGERNGKFTVLIWSKE